MALAYLEDVVTQRSEYIVFSFFLYTKLDESNFLFYELSFLLIIFWNCAEL